MNETYKVEGFKCPVIVVDQEDKPEGAELTERCDAAVFVAFFAELPAWKAFSFVECMEGHDLSEMARDITRDPDGVPIGV